MFKKNWLNTLALTTVLCLLTACTSPVGKDAEKDPAPESDELHVPETSLQKGDQDQSVNMLQKILMEIDYPIQTTGKFDADTTWAIDRKSTRLNSSHVAISYAVFCLKKKNIVYYIINIIV